MIKISYLHDYVEIGKCIIYETTFIKNPNQNPEIIKKRD